MNSERTSTRHASEMNSFDSGFRRVLTLLIALMSICLLANADTTSSISGNFNGTAIAGGNYIWFTSVLKPSGLGSTPVTIYVRKSTISFTANGANYTISVPDANIVFNPNATTATTTFNSTTNQWDTTVPSSGLAGNTLLDAVEYLVPAGGLPGGIKNVTWQINFSTDTSGISLNWQWAAGVYPTFSTAYNSLGVKPVDDTKASQYQNSDHAGTPENYKSYVVGGATGGGASNYTGSLSATVGLAVPLVQSPTANAGGPYSGFVAQAIAFNGGGSSDPNGDALTYSWAFGDGGTATGATPTHTYTAAGTFTVTLSVTDGRNATGTATSTATITAPPPPSITATQNPPPNAAGWNNSSVTVSFTCTDSVSGIKTCSAPVTVTTPGANQSVTGTAVNNAGESTPVTVKISIDETPPTITATPSPAPDGAGWNNTNVTVNFACADSLSGIAQCPSPVVVSASGASQVVSGTASDKAGNSTAATLTLNVELTLPSIVALASPGPNANGWNNTNVTVSFTCTASTAPITSCPSPQVVSAEGANQVVTGTVTDAAANSNTAKVTLNIGKTPPTIAPVISPPPNASGWNNSAVKVTFTCTAGTAPLATCPAQQTISSEGANQVITGTATDVAGNSTTIQVPLNIAITPPTITAAVSPAVNVNGWNNSTPTVTFTCTAAKAPIASCPPPQTVSTQGANQTISGTVTDVAGNTATAHVDVSFATTAPTITASVFPLPDAQGWNNTPVTVSFVCTNTVAPIASCPGTQVISAGGANQSVTGTAADVAGNMASASVTLNIGTVPPTIVGVISPAPNPAGWNNSNVTATWTCVPGTAPLAVPPAPVVVNTEGANQIVTGVCTDVAGNSVSSSLTVNIDKTPPTITASPSPAPNAGGWNSSAVTVTFNCSDTLSGVAVCPPPQTVSTPGANQIVKGTASDVAGNSASTQITVNISETPPQIIPVIAPLPNAAGWNNTNVTVSFTCTPGPGAAPITSCPSPQIFSTEGASIPVSGTVTDAAGATATASAVIKLDKTPPTVTPNISPAPNSNGWETAPVTVSFTCSDSLSGVATCPSSTLISTDGANQPVTGVATDIAGNSATASANVNLEQALPTISASVSPVPNSAGWNNTAVTVTFTCNKSVSAIVSCTSPQTVSAQGVGQVITGTVVDQAGNQATTSATLNIDEALPSILQFTAPSQLSPGQSGSATLTVSDIAAIASVVFELDGTTIGTSLAPPYTVSVTAPTTATSGSTLTLTAVVTDIAGNSSSANKGIQIVSSGVIVGQVLSDTTGLQLAGATVSVIGQASETATSDSFGRYSIPVTSNQLFLSIAQPGNSGGTPAMVTVERQTSVQSGVGTVPVDARLTALAPPTTITGSGGTVGTGAITVTVPAGGATTLFNLTPLSQQGLPGLLPLGWSPVAAFDLRTNVSTSAALSANFTGLPTGSLYLVSYSYNVHAWNMVTPNLSASSGSLTVTLPSTGDYALVIPDAANTSIQFPATGQPLTGVPMVALPTNATSSGSLSPANIAPTGGTSMASLAVQSSATLPSGTVIQTEVTETYTLTTGQALSEEPRYEDILLYQNPATSSGVVGASFPVTPSQTFQVSQLSSGDVHMDILSGRESVRGQTGGSDPVAVQSGDATLTIAAGSLPQDTAIAVTPETVDTFLPATSTLAPISEYKVDFSGQVLTAAAQLSVGLGTATPGSNVVIAQIQRMAGVPFLVVVSMGQVTATNIVSQVTPGLPGITQGGDYVFYQLTVPTGFVSGTVSASTGPVAATVQTDALPFVAFSNSNGNYALVAAAGTVHLTASLPNTALAGTTTAQVTAGQTASANLSVVGQVESASVTPANGALGVPLTAEIDITAADAFNPATATSSSVVLTAAGSNTPIALRFVFSAANTKLAVFPLTALQASTQYTLQASGLANALGGLISVPTTSFTTAAIVAPTYNTNALVFAMPDSNGNVAISAPANSFPAGSTILIVDQTNGVVYSLTVFNDGSVTGQMPATISDILQVTLTDPSGGVTNFTVSQFVAADGTTAIGAGGGTVVGPGGTGIIIPSGALPQGTTFKLTQLDQTAFPTLPTWQGVNFGSGLRIHDPAMPTFKKEAKLAFPVPAGAPSNAFYYVYRRLMDQNGNTYFETIDEAFVQGTGANAQVVTASPPFCGYHNSYGNFKIQAGTPPVPLTMIDQDYFVMWDVAAQSGPSGVASQGLIVGLAQQTVPAVIGQSAATTEPAQGTVTITLGNTNNVAIADGQCATFTLFDPQLGGGTRTVTATQVPSSGNTPLTATVDEVDGAQSDDGLYAIYAGLEDLYKNIGRVNFLFPPATPPPPPPAVSIQLFTLDQNGHRVPAGGILQSGTNVVIAFKSSLTVQSASISGTQLDVETPDSTDGEVTDGLPEQSLLSARVQNLYPLGAPASYTLTATGIDPLSLTTVTSSQSILVVAAGGNNTSTFTCNTAQPPSDPTAGCILPQVISISPANNAASVSPAVFPVITFSEPVTNISSSNVILSVANLPSNPANQIGMVVPVVLVGVRVPNPANPNQSPIADPVGANDVITSLTIEPTNGLGYSETYTLTLNAAAPSGCLDPSNNPKPQTLPTSLIVDQNQPPAGPFCLPPYGTSSQSYQFTTFGPQDLGGVNTPYGEEVLTRPVVIGNTAYAGEYLSSAISGLGMFDVTDPSHPKDLGPGADFVGRAIDITGIPQSPVTGGPLVAISSGTAVDNTIPGNVWLYDVSNPTVPNRVGAVSVTSDTSNGIAIRLFMKDQYLYASTFEQGLQVIDLGQAVAEYSQTSASDFGQAVSTAGDGFAMDAITNTIPIPLATGGQATMFDLKADNFTTSNGGGTQTLLVAAGQLPFVMVDPTISGLSAIVYPPSSGGTFSTNPVKPLMMTSTDGTTNSLLCYGQAVDIGTIAVPGNNGSSTSEHIAVVVGNGIIGSPAQATSCPTNPPQPSALPEVPVLAVVNITAAYTPNSPLTPQLIGLLQLPTTGTDVALSGTTVLISTGTNVLLVSLENPAQPTLAGQITGNFGNWIGTSSGGIIVGSSNAGSNSGIQTTTLGSYIVIQNMSPAEPQVDDSGNTLQPIQLTLNAQGQTADFQNAQVLYTEDGVLSATIPVGNLQPGLQTVTIPTGLHMTTSSPIVSVSITGADGSVTPTENLLLSNPGAVSSSASGSGSGSSGGGSSGSGSGGGGSSGGGSSGGGSTGQSGSSSLPPFSTVSPLSIALGSPDTTVTVTGTSLNSISVVYVRGMDGQWNPISVNSSTNTSAQLTLPASLLATEGFLEVAPVADDESSLPLLVYDPTLPPVGTLSSVQAVSVDNDNQATLLPSTFTVSGTNFASGMSVVLGRGATPGIVLPTSLLDSETLMAQIPVPFAADAADLFAAVLSADGSSLSALVPYPAPLIQAGSASSLTSPSAGSDLTISQISPGIDPDEAIAVAQFGATETGITSINGTLVQTVGSANTQTPQLLTINGANLSDGLLVTFTTEKGGQPLLMTSSLTGTQSVATLVSSNSLPVLTATNLMSSTISVPTSITDTKAKSLQVQSAKAKSGVSPVTEEPPLVVPFGARTMVRVYQDPSGIEHIERPSAAPATYQAFTNGVISISNFAPNPTQHNTIEQESESGDPSNSARIRGTALRTLPCNNISQLNLTPAVPCSSTPRAFAQLQAKTSNGFVIATRNVEVIAAKLGAQFGKYDSLEQYYGDMYGVPPTFLKSQALQESASYNANFRYEFTTINVGCLSGDLGVNTGVCTGSANIPNEPWNHYVMTGTSLGSYAPTSGTRSSQILQAQETQTFAFNPQNPGQTQFGLGVPVKRTVGGYLLSTEVAGGKEVAAKVTASVQGPNNKISQLALYHLDSVWQKAGGNVTPGVSALASNQFAVDYGTGNITLGSPLQVGQQLTVAYWPVQNGYSDNLQQTVIPTVAGDLISGAPDLATSPQVKQLSHIIYAANKTSEPLSIFLQTNVANGTAFLTGARGDMDIEFSVGSNGKPTQPRDPRYSFMTAQPYASSSYGLLQLTLLAFGPGLQVKLNRVFNPGYSSGQSCPAAARPCAPYGTTPLYQLLTQPQANFNLGGNFHFLTLSAEQSSGLSLCGISNRICNESQWEQQWSQIINQYNVNGPAYSGSTSLIVKNGATKYAPKDLQ